VRYVTDIFLITPKLESDNNKGIFKKTVVETPIRRMKA